MPSVRSADFSLIRSADKATLVLPGFLAGFLIQSKMQRPSIYAHSVALPASMFVTNMLAKVYYKEYRESAFVSDYKHSTETACTGAFFMYGLGLITGSLWKAYWLKQI